MLSEKYERHARLLAKVIRDVLRVERFETIADLTDAVKARCARLHIPWTADELNEAFGMIDSNTPLLVEAPRPTNPTHLDRAPEGFDPPKDLARGMVATLHQQLGTRAPIKTMPQVELITPREADRRKALEMLAREMQASIDRCTTLEKEPA